MANKIIQGQGDGTEYKERRLGAGFFINLKISSRNQKLKKFPYFHFDLYSGSGFNDKAQCDGSPIAFLRAAKDAGKQNIFAYFIDNNIAAINELRVRINGDSRVFIRHCDNTIFIPEIPDIIKAHGDRPEWAVGSILIDPNGYDIPWDLVIHISELCPRLDMFINWNAGAVKRWRGLESVSDLRSSSRLLRIDEIPAMIKKTHVLISERVGSQSRFVLMICRNHRIDEIRSLGFFHFNGPKGMEIREKQGYTKAERSVMRSTGQLPLDWYKELMMNTVVDLKHNQRPTIDDRFELIRSYDRQAYFDKGRELKAIRDEMHRDKKAGFDELCEAEIDLERSFIYRVIDAYICAEKLLSIGQQIPQKERQVRELLKLQNTGNDDEHRADVWQRCLESGQKITAKFIAEQVQKKLAELSRNWITIDGWKNLSDEERANVLNRASNKTFNKQDNASIEWAQWSWNPITGCLHDCPYCYARDIAERFYPAAVGFNPVIYPERFAMPANTQAPDKAREDVAFKNVFACSMADLFGRWVPAEWIAAVLATAAENDQWNFLFLTKFPKRMAEFDIPENCWMGTTVDCQARVKNAEKAFAKVNSGVRWLSVEPMLEPLKFERLDLFDWIVIGGASSSNKTPTWVPPIDWIVDLHQQARSAGCKIYYKTNCGMTDDLRIKEFPWGITADKKPPSVFQYLGKEKAENQSVEQ